MPQDFYLGGSGEKMANSLDDVNGPVMQEGRDINVIAKQVPSKVGIGSTIFEILLWFCVVPGIVILIMSLTGTLNWSPWIGVGVAVAGLIVPIVYLIKKVNAGNYLMQLEQKIQHAASQVDNYLEQRVQILQNMVPLVEKSVKLDQDTYTAIAALRTGGSLSDTQRNELAANISKVSRGISVAVEAYPTLQSQQNIAKAMNENSYLQKEITAAREVYNDSVLRWNTAIFEWPCKQIVASKRGYTTRIPFAADQETKAAARSVFFK